MSDFIVKENEREDLFWTLFYDLISETNTEVVHGLGKKANKVKKLRSILERLVISLNFEKKLTADEWITAGITKFASEKELEKVIKEGFKYMEEGGEKDGLFRHHFQKVIFFYEKLGKKAKSLIKKEEKPNLKTK